MHCDWNDWIKRRQGVKCLAKNTTWLTWRDQPRPTGGHYRAPSYNRFGCHGKRKIYLATEISTKVANWWLTGFLKKKKEKNMQKIYKPLSNYQRLNANKLFCNSQIHVLTKCFLWQPFYNIDGCQSATFWKIELGALHFYLINC